MCSSLGVLIEWDMKLASNFVQLYYVLSQCKKNGQNSHSGTLVHTTNKVSRKYVNVSCQYLPPGAHFSWIPNRKSYVNPWFPPNFLMIENCLFLFPVSLIYSHHSNHVSRVKRDPQIPFLTCPNGNRDPRIIVYEKCGPVGAKSKGMHENWNLWNL